eukprot:4845676-Lingulodinium_polyedra.AAC.1
MCQARIRTRAWERLDPEVRDDAIAPVAEARLIRCSGGRRRADSEPAPADPDRVGKVQALSSLQRGRVPQRVVPGPYECNAP